MRTIFVLTALAGLFFFGLGGYLAYSACDPATLNTVNPDLMGLATIITIIGIFMAFGSWICYEDVTRNP